MTTSEQSSRTHHLRRRPRLPGGPARAPLTAAADRRAAAKAAGKNSTVLGLRGVVVCAEVVTAVTAVLIAVPSPAGATSGRGVAAKTLWQTSADGTDYVLREITIAPGGSTGWHWHDGRLYGVIKNGTLTHNMADCSVDGVYQPGDSVAEPAGADHVHIGRNLGNTPLVLQVLYVDPAGTPLSEDAPNPGCGYT